MKKILMILICVFTFTACTSSNGGNIEYTSIDAALAKMDQKESFLLLISKDSCSHCKDLEAMLDDSLAKHAITIYNVKLNESSDEAYNADIAKLEVRLDKPGRTPHIYYIENGEVQDEMVGYSEGQEDKFWDWVKETGLESIQ